MKIYPDVEVYSFQLEYHAVNEVHYICTFMTSLASLPLQKYCLLSSVLAVFEQISRNARWHC